MLEQIEEMKRLDVKPDLTTYTQYLRYYQQTWPERKAERLAKQRSQADPYDALVNDLVQQHLRDEQIAKGEVPAAMDRK